MRSTGLPIREFAVRMKSDTADCPDAILTGGRALRKFGWQ